MQILDKDSIQRGLQKINIPFDAQVITEVQSFLAKYIGPLNSQDALYHIPAACAIICETIKIDTIDKNSLTGTGIKIQNVMRHIGPLSKEKFLEVVQSQLKKADFQKHYLIQKVVHVKIAFRVFKKFKTIFQRLSIQAKLPRAHIQQLEAFVWIVYLIIQHHLDALENLNMRTKLLVILIEEIFCTYFGKQKRENIRQYINSKDNFPQIPTINQQQEFGIKTQIYNQINSTIKRRDASASPNCNNLITNLPFLARLVDDLSSQYQKLYTSLPDGKFIDQITFLELTKNLTPQAFAFKNPSQQITKVINFGNDSDDEDLDSMEDQMKTEDKKPNFAEMLSSEKQMSTNLFASFSVLPQTNTNLRMTKSMSDYTPVSLGNTKSTWAHSFIQNFNGAAEKQIKQYFNEKGINYEQFSKKSKEKMENQVSTLTRYNINKQKNAAQTLRMFFSFCYQLICAAPNYQLAAQHKINSIMCISAYLYNSTTRYLSLQLQKYTEVYNTNLIQCLITIYDISQKISLPLVIKQILSELEKQVLIKELWDSEAGYNLLMNQNDLATQPIRNRLNRRIYERIKEICQANKVDLTEVQKIQALLKEIIKKKPQMLNKNKLDQIIICSISACLNLNQAKYNLALSTIFQKYNSVSLSFHSNQEIVSPTQEQAPKTLLEFYNSAFIHEVQDMMSKEQNPKYLYTPIRQNHLRKLKDCSIPFPPISRFAGGMTSALGGDGGGMNSYRKQILEKMKSSQKGEKIEQQCDSPYFGTNSQSKKSLQLNRKITFGDAE